MGLESKDKVARNTEKKWKAEAGVGQEYHQARDDKRYLLQMTNVYFRFWNFAGFPKSHHPSVTQKVVFDLSGKAYFLLL